MDINKLALELQQNQSVRQKILCSIWTIKTTFSFRIFMAYWKKKSCLNIYNMLKNIKSWWNCCRQFCAFLRDDLIGACYSENPAPSISARRNCVFSLAHCELSVFQACVLFSIVQEMELFCFILDDMLRKKSIHLPMFSCLSASQRHQQIGDSGRACADWEGANTLESKRKGTMA